MQDLAARLTSRKFLLVLVAVAFFLAVGELELARDTVLGFLVAEGAGDVAGRVAEVKFNGEKKKS